MNGGLFIALYDEDSLKLYLNKGLYGFLMPPIKESVPSSHSRHYAILADYACSREGAELFFFLKTKNAADKPTAKAKTCFLRRHYPYQVKGFRKNPISAF